MRKIIIEAPREHTVELGSTSNYKEILAISEYSSSLCLGVIVFTPQKDFVIQWADGSYSTHRNIGWRDLIRITIENTSHIKFYYGPWQ